MSVGPGAYCHDKGDPDTHRHGKAGSDTYIQVGGSFDTYSHLEAGPTARGGWSGHLQPSGRFYSHEEAGHSSSQEDGPGIYRQV